VKVVSHPNPAADNYLFGSYEARHDALYEERD
jgi:hypothetical protein